MRLLLILLLVTLPLKAHEDVFTAGYAFDEGYTIGYHRVHKQAGEVGFYVNGFYSQNTHYNSELGSVTSETIETRITEFINNTISTSSTTYHRAIKCNKHGKCHEYGPPIETTIVIEETTTEPVTTSTFDTVYESTYVESKRKNRNLILNVGLNYSIRSDVFVYGGLGVFEKYQKFEFSNSENVITDRKVNHKINVNIGLLVNDKDGHGLDFGYNTATQNLYVGVSYEW